MAKSTKEKMLNGANQLIRRRGINATSVREVVRYTDTPRGSIRHHFPGGKLQLVEEAIVLAGQEVSVPLGQLLANKGTLAGIAVIIDAWRHNLVSSDFQAGCPVMMVAVEQFMGEDGEVHVAGEQSLLNLANGIYNDWKAKLINAMQAEGVTPARARRLAHLVIASVEGTIPLCRSAKSTQPLDDVHTELNALIKSAIS